MKKLSRKQWILGISALVIVGGGVTYWQKHKTPPDTIKEFKVERGDIDITFQIEHDFS